MLKTLELIETPFIVDSKIHNSVQLADLVSYLVRRYAMKYFGLSPGAFFNHYCDDLMAFIENKFIDMIVIHLRVME